MPAIYDFMCRIQDFTTLPQVALQLCHLTAREDSTTDEIEALLRLDPVLVSRLLHLVNSAYYGLRYPVSDLTKALLILGTKALRNLVLVDALKGCFLQRGSEGKLDHVQLWVHCVAVGVGAKFISRRLLGQPGEDAFLAGLLHDLGLLVEERTIPDLFGQVPKTMAQTGSSLIRAEQTLLGTDHTLVGSTLVGTWGLPSFIIHSIAKHHTQLEAHTPLDQPGALVQIAHALATEAGYAIDIDADQPSPELVALCIAHHAEEFQVLLDDFVAEMEVARSIYQG